MLIETSVNWTRVQCNGTMARLIEAHFNYLLQHLKISALGSLNTGVNKA